MIVDCHTHAWADVSQLGPFGPEFLRAAHGMENFGASVADHALASQCVDKVLVLGLAAGNDTGQAINDYIAQYVARDNRAIGIGSVNPADSDAPRYADALLRRSEFRGLVCSPLCQDFHPSDSRAMAIYDLAQDRKVPVFFDHATHWASFGRMEYARPSLLDEVAREFPNLKIVVSALGYPWTDEAIALLGKHPNAYADLASLLRRPWQAYNALVLAHQFNVIDKVLFGSDFPYFTAAEAIENVYRLHEMTHGTNLPTVPREALRSVVERSALTVLGIARPGESAGTKADDEEIQ